MKAIKHYFLVLLFISGIPLSTSAQDYEVLVSSRGENAVKLYDTEGNFISNFVEPGDGGLASTQDMFFHPDGTVLVTGIQNSAIKQYDGLSGNFIQNFSSGWSLNNPSKMALGPDNLLYVTQWGSPSDKTVRFDLDGNFVDEFTSISAYRGLGQLWDSEGNYYVALFSQSGTDGTIEKLDPDGNHLETFINSSILQGPTCMWWDDNGDMLVEDWTSGVVRRYDSDGNFLSNFITGLINPEGMDVLPNGNILIGDWGNDAVRLIDSSGNLLGNFAIGNGLIDPNSVRIRQSPTVGIDESTQNAFSIFPNPVQDLVNIQISSGFDPMWIEMTNILGERVLITAFDEVLDLNEINTGLYVIQLINEEGEKVARQLMVK